MVELISQEFEHHFFTHDVHDKSPQLHKWESDYMTSSIDADFLFRGADQIASTLIPSHTVS